MPPTSHHQQVPAHRIAAVKDATDLAALVSEYVPLKKAGTRLTGRCPFHEERTASFGVNPLGFYMCFGCGAKGDALSFLQRIEGISFHEALKRLAERAGISLEQEQREPVSALALRYEREEAAIAQWWWASRRQAVMELGCDELAKPDLDQEWLGCLYRMRIWIDGLSVAEKWQVFKDGVTAEDRAEWRSIQEYEHNFSQSWLSLAVVGEGHT
jgi:CHC2-type zinc finger protein